MLTVHPRHTIIKYNSVDVMFFGQLDTCDTIGRCQNVVTLDFQQQLANGEAVRQVVDAENGCHNATPFLDLMRMFQLCGSSNSAVNSFSYRVAQEAGLVLWKIRFESLRVSVAS